MISEDCKKKTLFILMFSVEQQRMFPWVKLLVGPNFAVPLWRAGFLEKRKVGILIKQEQIVLERSARLNLDPGRGD